MPLLLLSMFLGVGIAVYSAAGRWRQLGWHLGMVSGLLPEDYHAPDMSTDIAKGWAVVTGGSRGIGRAFVRLLAADGWALIILDVPDAELDAAQHEATELGSPRAETVGLDVAADVDKAVADLLRCCAPRSAGRRIRLVVGNLGVSTRSPALLSQCVPLLSQCVPLHLGKSLALASTCSGARLTSNASASPCLRCCRPQRIACVCRYRWAVGHPPRRRRRVHARVY